MTDAYADPGDVPMVPPVPSLVAVTGPLLDGPTAAIVTATHPDGAITVVAFPPLAGMRPISTVYPAGYPGYGYRYDWPDELVIGLPSPGLAGPDGDPAEPAPAPVATGDSPAASGSITA